MRKIAIYLLALMLSMGMAVAQTGGGIQPGDQDMGWRGKLKKAQELMEQGSYYNAIAYYEAAMKEKGGDADIAYELATAYYLGRNYKKAQDLYKQAFDAEPKKYCVAQFYYAQMLHVNGNYSAAASQYDDFAKNSACSGSDMFALKRLARDKKEGAEMAMKWKEEESNIVTRHLDKKVNENYTEFSPIIVGDSLLIYASLRMDEDSKDSVMVLDDRGDKMNRARFYKSVRMGENNYTMSQELEGPFNDGKDHSGNGTYSLDGNRFYFTKCENTSRTHVSCDIYVSEKKNGKWSDPKPMKDLNDEEANDTHPTIAPYKDKEIIYFASDRQGGRGGMDIYYAELDDEGMASYVRRISTNKLNTEGDEMTPFYDRTEDVLYFASNGHPGAGGLDIFKTKGERTRWASPINLGFPVNSSYDDFYYVRNKKGNMGYVVSNRDGAYSPKWPHCCDDIFEWEEIIPPTFWIMGHVYDTTDGKNEMVDSANVALSFAGDGQVIDFRLSSSDTMFEFYRGTEFKNYHLSAQKQGYTGDNNTTSTVGLEESDTLYVDLYIDPIDPTKIITLRNVYYDFDECYIRPDAKPSLDSAYRYLAENPNIKVELGSHTDNRGTAAYNRDLAQCRADSAVRYLIMKGIDSSRIVAKGYGEDKPAIDCGANCTELEHQLNRRTELRILGEIEGVIITYDESEIERVKKHPEGTEDKNQDIWDFGPDEEDKTPPDGGGGN